jgi:hypothetical protein
MNHLHIISDVHYSKLYANKEKLINNVYVFEINNYYFKGEQTAFYLFDKRGAITQQWGIIHQIY